MKNILKLLLSVFIVSGIYLYGCKEPFRPDLKFTKTEFLVVEGYIDAVKPTQILLSKTRLLTFADTASKIIVTKAVVIIEGDDNSSYLLNEVTPGNYLSNIILPLKPTGKYRVRIHTSEGGEYISSFVPYVTTPAIDSINYVHMPDQSVQINVNTHSNSTKPGYYRWQYDDTWEFDVYYRSELVYNRITQRVDQRQEMVQKCWRNSYQTNINIANTERLSSNIVSNQPLRNIAYRGQELSIMYSINVTQYALDEEAYNFWDAMKKNTEKVGSIFDPQPNLIKGNFKSVKDPTEPVVGYVSVGNSVTKRAFFPNAIVGPRWNPIQDCPLVEIPNMTDSIKFYFGSGMYVPVVTGDNNTYMGAVPECADCTLRGNNKKPSFWP